MTLTTTHSNVPDLFDDRKVQLLRDTICKGSNDEELQLFIHACKRTGLDPFMKQVHAVKRWDSTLKRESMTIQTGIDGYRLIADRTGNYAPGREPTFTYDNQGKLVCATAYVKKRTADGTWHEVSASAHYAEYAGLTREGKPNTMWATKGHIMLAKCAEALALRKAFPADLSGIYTKEEMDQADNHQPSVSSRDPHISEEEAKELEALLGQCDQKYFSQVIKQLEKLGITSFDQITVSLYGKIKVAALKKRDEFLAQLKQETVEIKEEVDE